MSMPHEGARRGVLFAGGNGNFGFWRLSPLLSMRPIDGAADPWGRNSASTSCLRDGPNGRLDRAAAAGSAAVEPSAIGELPDRLGRDRIWRLLAVGGPFADDDRHLADNTVDLWLWPIVLVALGALAAGLSYATMGQVLVLGRLAETEATFTLLLSGALLAWHWGYSQSWRQTLPWLAGYGLAALAALAKGPQAPVYFAGPVWLFLAWRCDWRMLWSWSHLAGLARFVATVGAWQIPFWMQMGWPAVKTLWLGDVAMRFADTRWQTIALHLLSYPLEIAICTLPWSPLLVSYLSKGFRRSIGKAESYVAYLVMSIGLAFFTCWVVPGARGRYFMPLYPCLALLIGLSVQQVAEPTAAAWQRRGWKLFLLSKAVLAILAGVSVAGVTWIERFELAELRQPGWFAAIYVFIAVIAGILLAATQASFRPARVRIALLAIAALIGMSYVGVVINGMAGTAEDPTPEVAHLKRKLPSDARLVSFGLVETLFTYLYRAPIEERPWPKTAADLGAGHDYFCFTWDRPQPPPLPFGWTIEGVIPCDRVRRDPPLKKVIVGKRIDSLANRSPQPF